MGELSQTTLGRVRDALNALEPEGEYSSGERQEFWKRTLFDAGFAPAFTEIAATYQFNWTEIIPHLYIGKFGSQNQTFATVVPPGVGELYLNRLVVFALEQSKDAPIGEQIRESLHDDGFPISGGLRTGTPPELAKMPAKESLTDKIPSPPTQPVGAQDDRRFARLALEEARKSISEPDGRLHPKVGAVVVKDGKILATAHRGEAAGNHAEYIALEKRLPDAAVAGATVYTTLEPCTTRNHPKIPCAERLVERKVARVVIGMLDPDPRITGRGQRRLRSANIVTDLFPHDLMTEVEELNREFTRSCEQRNQTGQLSEPLRLNTEIVGEFPDGPRVHVTANRNIIVTQIDYLDERDVKIASEKTHQGGMAFDVPLDYQQFVKIHNMKSSSGNEAIPIGFRLHVLDGDKVVEKRIPAALQPSFKPINNAPTFFFKLFG